MFWCPNEEFKFANLERLLEYLSLILWGAGLRRLRGLARYGLNQRRVGYKLSLEGAAAEQGNIDPTAHSNRDTAALAAQEHSLISNTKGEKCCICNGDVICSTAKRQFCSKIDAGPYCERLEQDHTAQAGAGC